MPLKRLSNSWDQKIVAGLRAGLFFVIVCLPLYLLRFKVFGIPTTVLEQMIYLLFLFWLFSKSTLPKPLFNKRLWPVALIFLGVSLSALFASDLTVAGGIWKGWFVDPLLLMLVIIGIVKSQQQVRALVKALVLSTTVVALIGFVYWWANQLTYDGRLAAFYLSPNHLAMYLTPGLIFSFYFFAQSSKLWVRGLSVVASLFMLIALFKTQSYGAWLGLGLAMTFLLIICW